MSNPYATPDAELDHVGTPVRYHKLSLACAITAAIGLLIIVWSNIPGLPFVHYLPDPIGLALAIALTIHLGWLAWLEKYGSEARLHRTKWIAIPVVVLSFLTLIRFAMLFNTPATGTLLTFPELMVNPFPSVIALCYVVQVFARGKLATPSQET